MKLSKIPLFRFCYSEIRNSIMSRNGSQPFGEYIYSSTGQTVKNRKEYRIPMPNLTRALNPVLRQFIDLHGLGKRCLLVSESNSVKQVYQRYFPDVEFVTCDNFPELMPSTGQTNSVDVKWDVCCPPPEQFIDNKFDAVISHAVLEHVIAPTTAIVNLFSICAPRGFVYIMTCTPSFHYHAFPRDYVRFHHDYFFDLPAFIKQQTGMDVQLLELFSCQGLISMCFHKGPVLHA